MSTPQTFVAQAIADKSTLNPPICPEISPQLKVRGWAKPTRHTYPRPAHVDLRRPKILACHQNTHMGKSRIFPGFPLHARFTLSDLLFRNQNTRCGTRVRRCNEADVFDTPCRVSGSCARDGCLTNTGLRRPLRRCSDPQVDTSDTVG